MNSMLIIILTLVLMVQPCYGEESRFNHAQHTVELGWQYFFNGDSKTALRRFEQSRLLNPEFAPSYFGTAYVLSTQGRLEEAVSFYKKAIELDPSFPHSFSNLGLSLFYLGKKEEAWEYLKKALELAPKDGDVNVNLAVWYYESGQYAKAWEHIKTARKVGAEVKKSLVNDLSQKMKEPE